MTDHKVGTREEWLAARQEPILDRAPKGRNEDEANQVWIRRHDEYEHEEAR